jgi:hypothetical protein
VRVEEHLPLRALHGIETTAVWKKHHVHTNGGRRWRCQPFFSIDTRGPNEPTTHLWHKRGMDGGWTGNNFPSDPSSVVNHNGYLSFCFCCPLTSNTLTLTYIIHPSIYIVVISHSESAPTSTASRMDGKWSGNSFLLGSSSLANHGG